MTFTYALPKNSQAWHMALDSISDRLPEGLLNNIHNQPLSQLAYQQLDQLPIFALIVVCDNHQTVKDAMDVWAKTQSSWQLIHVIDDEHAKANAHLIQSDEQLSQASTHRYLLAPTHAIHMDHDKKIAAAHMIDEQISAHLRQNIVADVHILSIAQMLSQHRLACFDMDSTLIEEEVIVELARFCQVETEVEAITERAMRGEIDFATSFAQRVALLKNAPISIVDEIIAKHIHIQSGAATTIKALKAIGYHTILVSGGFEPFARYVATTLGMDEYFANPLLSDGQHLTGDVDDAILDGQQKARIVQKIAHKLQLQMNQVVCIGDGANDLPMMAISDIGIAYKAKPIVQAKASAAINLTGLEGVLYVLGHRLDLI